jgi:hypothetical protein
LQGSGEEDNDELLDTDSRTQTWIRMSDTDTDTDTDMGHMDTDADTDTDANASMNAVVWIDDIASLSAVARGSKCSTTSTRRSHNTPECH